MAVAAPILPPAPDELDVPGEVRDELRARWAVWWEPLREELRAHPPVPDTAEERVVLARFVRGLVALTDRFGSALRPLLRAGFSRAFEDIIVQEESQAEAIRRLGFKLLGRAVEVLGGFFEAASAFAPPSLPVDHVEQLVLDDIALAQLLDPPSVAMLRLELAVFVAFDLAREEPLEDFALWARIAHVAARRAAPFATMLSTYSRAPTQSDVSADIVLPAIAFAQVVDLVESPPAPSATLRSLLRRGTA